MDEAWNNPFPLADSVLEGWPVSLVVHALCLELVPTALVGAGISVSNSRPELFIGTGAPVTKIAILN